MSDKRSFYMMIGGILLCLSMASLLLAALYALIATIMRVPTWAAILFLVALSPILLAVLRFLGVLRGCIFLPERKKPCVTIQGQDPLILIREDIDRVSPKIDLTADGKPSGGSCNWSIVSGAEKIYLEGDKTAKTIGVRPKKADCSYDDIVIKVDYSTPKGSASDQAILTVYRPAAAVLVDTVKKDFGGEMVQEICGTTYTQGPYYGYEVKTQWQILDQFGGPFPGQVLSLEEKLIVSENPYNTPFQERNWISDESGVYPDCYAIIFQGRSVPTDYVAKVRQIVRAEGFVILDQQLIYGPTDVQIVTPDPQLCPQ